MPDAKPTAKHPAKLNRKFLIIGALAVVAFVLLRKKLTGGATPAVATIPAADPYATPGDAAATAGDSSQSDLLSAQIDGLYALSDTLAGRLTNVEDQLSSGAGASTPAAPPDPVQVTPLPQSHPLQPATVPKPILKVALGAGLGTSQPTTPQPVVNQPASKPGAHTEAPKLLPPAVRKLGAGLS